MLRLSLSGARQFKRPDGIHAPIGDFHAASTRGAIQIYAAMRTQTAAVLPAKRTRRQCEQDLLANQPAQVHLVALIEREFQVFRTKIVVIVSDRLGRQHEAKRTIARRVEILGASRAHGPGPGLQHAREEQFRARAIARHRHFDRSFQVILADRSLAQDTVDFLLRLGERHLFGIRRYVLDSDFHRSRDALDGIMERELLHFERDVQIVGWRRRGFRGSVGTISSLEGRLAMATERFTFPANFLWGTATAAHQVEGNNVNSDFWVLEHTPGSPFVEPSGDACDQYHRYADDIAMLARLGFNAYRFSIEWARIEPEPGEFSRAALDHYRRVLACCHEHKITPVVTFHHFTSPRWVAGDGGWAEKKTAERFARYCERAAAHLGDLIGVACTINEANLGAYQYLLGALPLKLDPLRLEWFAEAARRIGADPN